MIERVEILNYKSFEHQIFEEISQGVNLILGLNGQGKSNFYSAIKFCLTLENSDLIPEEQKRSILNVD